MNGKQGQSPHDPALETVRYLVESLVEQPAEVRVVRRGPTLRVQVARGDEGRVIGRGGRVIAAVRTLAEAAAGRRQTVNLDTADGERGR